MDRDNAESCPECGFSYAYDGNTCMHCKGKAEKPAFFVSLWKMPCKSCGKLVPRIVRKEELCRECFKSQKEQKERDALNSKEGILARCPCCNRIHDMSFYSIVLGKKESGQYPCWRHEPLKCSLLSMLAGFGLTLVGLGSTFAVGHMASENLEGKTFVGPGLHPGIVYALMGLVPVSLVAVGFIVLLEGLSRAVVRLLYAIWSLKG